MNEISSPHNPKYRRWMSLHESKGIAKEQRTLICGSKLVQELCVQRPDDVEEIILPPKVDPLDYRFHHTRLTAPLFKALDLIGTKGPLAVMRTPHFVDWTGTENPRGLELILALSDPNNLGACLRSAEAFGAQRVILTEECASPFLPKAVRASSGSALRLKLARTGPLKSLSCPSAVGLDMDGQSLFDFSWPENLYLILGEEGQGLPAAIVQHKIKIPMRPPVESLNATVAAAVAMFSYSKSR
ncbi:MAG: RNA methyltransferase [Bdellovibrionales bacterium]|nr:RNA methyltransferase [Bdellovibrionales bacterium]